MEAAESAEIADAIVRSLLENAARFPQLPHPRRRARLLRVTVHEIGGGPERRSAGVEPSAEGSQLEAEVRRLRRQVASLEKDKELLKKVLAIFSETPR